MSNNPQDRDSWVAKRRGKVTASRVGDVTRRTAKGTPYAEYDKYLTELVVERLTNKATDHFVSDAMQWGLDHEEAAAQHYAFERGLEVKFSDFVDHPTIEMSGASPDRLVGDDGLLEIKCPTTKTHIEFLLTGDIDIKYQWQMTWQMICTGRQWCDFMSYDPRLPVHLQCKVKRFALDPQNKIDAEMAVREALAVVDERVAALEALGSPEMDEAA